MDTSQEIKNLQLKIWLEKSPMERLHQFMTDNEALIKFWKEVKKNSEDSDENTTEHLDKYKNNSIIKK